MAKFSAKFSAKLSVQPGADIDGFTVGQCIHRGGMATLWSVSRADIAAPVLMKIPRVSEGEDPAAIVRDRKSTRLNSSHLKLSRMPSSA